MNAMPQLKPVFGEITYDDLRKNRQLTQTVLPLVAEACKRAKERVTIDAVADRLIDGTFKLWGVMRPPADLTAVAVTRVEGKAFELLIVGPDYEEMLPFLPVFTSAAKSAGCTRMRMTGPSFWRKELPEGWKSAAVVYERALDAPAAA